MKNATAVLLVFLATAGQASAELASVWAVDDGTKVKATDVDHPLEGGNGIFSPGGPSIALFGARNEVVAFQVILEGGAAVTRDVRVLLNSLGPIENSGLTDSMDSYFIGRRIEIFLEHYLEVTTRSHDLAWQPGSAAEPAGMDGWIPDALVPLGPEDTLEVPAGRNQGIWIDVYIPPGTAPGTHDGTLVVEAGGGAVVEIPVALEVLDASLPDVPTTKTMLYFSGGDGDRDCMYARYSDDPWGAPSEQVDAMRLRHYKLGRRHRITMFIGAGDAPDDGLQQRIAGEAFSTAAGYAGPGQGLGQDMCSIHTYGGSLTSAQAATWVDWFDLHGPGTDYFLYIIDEPGPGDFEFINQVAAEAEPVPSFVTHAPAAGLEIDIYCAGAQGYAIAEAAQAEAQGKQVWIYNGVRPHTGSFVTDDVAVSPRVNPLIQHKYDIPRWFYWESTYYNDFQGGRGNINVFEDPINFSNSWGDEMNGDGLLVYPGRDFVFPAEDRGIDGPLPSVRLKNWRRGIQDVEYLVLARQAGEGALADEVLDTLVPRALDEGGLSGGEAVPWEEDGEVWLAQRRRLADLFRVSVEPDGGTDGDGGTPADDGGIPTDEGGMPPDDGGITADDGAAPSDEGTQADDGKTPASDGTGRIEGSGCGCGNGAAPGLGLMVLVLMLLRQGRVFISFRIPS